MTPVRGPALPQGRGVHDAEPVLFPLTSRRGTWMTGGHHGFHHSKMSFCSPTYGPGAGLGRKRRLFPSPCPSPAKKTMFILQIGLSGVAEAPADKAGVRAVDAPSRTTLVVTTEAQRGRPGSRHRGDETCDVSHPGGVPRVDVGTRANTPASSRNKLSTAVTFGIAASFPKEEAPGFDSSV